MEGPLSRGMNEFEHMGFGAEALACTLAEIHKEEGT